MSHIYLGQKCRAIAETETRAIKVLNDQQVPKGIYLLNEYFCSLPGCDCRNVKLYVVPAHAPDQIAAVITYGWDTPDYYQRWAGGEAWGREMAGVHLEPMSEQPPHALKFLQVVKMTLTPDYVARLVSHYVEFRLQVELDAEGTKTTRTSRTKRSGTVARNWRKPGRLGG
jgi:hypothetical protein